MGLMPEFFNEHMVSELTVSPQIAAPLDPSYQPSILWNRAYRNGAAGHGNRKRIVLRVGGVSGEPFELETAILAGEDSGGEATLHYLERLTKSLLWLHGGNRVWVAGDDDVCRRLAECYSPSGARGFDCEMMGGRIFPEAFQISIDEKHEGAREQASGGAKWGRHTEGCRIGFDLGGSDRKAAAVVDGEVVFSEEIEWDPYFQSDPDYHFQGIVDSLERVAKHLPRVDAVGGSAAGVYLENEVRVASLFRGVSQQDFDQRVRRIFFDVMAHLGWQDRPWRVINDGEVTALAGSMAIDESSLLGLSLGTSFAAGYVAPDGTLTRQLNELAFVPVDHGVRAPVDEWSGDRGCGVQYFSQQAVARLAQVAGLGFPEEVGFPERLLEVQRLMKQGDPRAHSIFQTIGVYLGYSIAHYAEFYELRHLLILGRVTSGSGGQLILDAAREVLNHEFPELSESIQFHIPDEQQKRHGQAVAAASLPPLADSH